MKKRTDKNSTTAAMTGFAGVTDDAILTLAGVELRSQKENLIWGQFIYASAKSDWRDTDLILLTKTVKMEANIRAAQVELDDIGIMIENKQGTPIPHPLILVIDTLERRQLAVIRSMSMKQKTSNQRTVNGTAKIESKSRAVLMQVESK